MIKLLLLSLFVVGCFIQPKNALTADEYIAFIEELSNDEQFVEDYTKWSLELFSDPDYLYGKHRAFPCSTAKDGHVPTSVHTLRPSDVKCVGAMGDSLTAGLGAHAITPIGLMFENRGISWSVGGDHTYTKILSVPNALRLYTDNLEGFSTKVSVMFLNGQNATNNRLNVAKSGDRSTNMPYQASLLLQRLKDEPSCDWNNDWKVITLFIGGNDLCSFCEDANETKHTPEQYLANVRDALDILYNAHLPRTLVNLVLVLDVRGVEELNSGGPVCKLLHKRTCPCAAFPTDPQRILLGQYVQDYQQVLIQLADSKRYDGRDDFTVVYQPFMAKTQLPRKPNHKIDFSYFAPDCFHFSGKGHAQAALSLWNNMLEPVGMKQWAWHMGEEIKCPTLEHPYIFTNNNSAQAVKDYLSSTTVKSTSDSASTPFSSTKRHKPTKEHHHKDRKHHKSNSVLTPINFGLFVAIVFLLIVLLVAAIVRRQQIRTYLHGAGRRHLDGFTKYTDDDDVEIWNRFGTKDSLTVNDPLPKTHGARMNFE